MKGIRLSAVFLWVLLSSVSAFSQSNDICCAWVNESYGSENRPQKLILNYDGTYEVYNTVESIDPIVRGNFLVVETWVDTDGFEWYKLKMMDFRGIRYKLARVGREGSRLEFVCATDAFPDTVDRADPGYCRYDRASLVSP